MYVQVDIERSNILYIVHSSEKKLQLRAGGFGYKLVLFLSTIFLGIMGVLLSFHIHQLSCERIEPHQLHCTYQVAIKTFLPDPLGSIPINTTSINTLSDSQITVLERQDEDGKSYIYNLLLETDKGTIVMESGVANTETAIQQKQQEAQDLRNLIANSEQTSFFYRQKADIAQMLMVGFYAFIPLIGGIAGIVIIKRTIWTFDKEHGNVLLKTADFVKTHEKYHLALNNIAKVQAIEDNYTDSDGDEQTGHYVEIVARSDDSNTYRFKLSGTREANRVANAIRSFLEGNPPEVPISDIVVPIVQAIIMLILCAGLLFVIMQIFPFYRLQPVYAMMLSQDLILLFR